MDIKNLFKRYIPSPLSSQSTLPELVKKSEVVAESLRFIAIIGNIFFLVVIGFILSNLLKLPINIISILIGFEIFSLLLMSYIKYLKIKSLSLIAPAADGKSFKAIVVTREYYNLISAIVGFCTSIAAVGLIFFFFWQVLSNLFIGKVATFNLGFFLKYLIFVFALFRFFDLIVKYIRYQVIKSIDANQNIAQVNQRLSLINKKFKLIAFVPGVSVALIILLLFGIPAYIISIFLGFIILMVILSLIELRRIAKVDLSIQTPTTVGIQNFSLRSGEKLVGTIFGIMSLKTTGFAFLGVGKTTNPENTLLITNNRLLFVQIPIPGSDKIIDSTAYSYMNFFWNRGEIKEKGNQIIASMSLEEVSKKYGVKEILFDEITNLTLKKMEITILTNTNQKHRYLFMDREYIEPLKQQFRTYLKDKFIEAN